MDRDLCKKEEGEEPGAATCISRSKIALKYADDKSFSKLYLCLILIY